MKEMEGEVAMLLEIEKDTSSLLLHTYSDDQLLDSNSEFFSGPFEPNNNGNSPISKIVSSIPPRKARTEDFMDSENEKSDYDWLLTPPGTPLFPSTETESQKNVTYKNDMMNSRPTALKPRLVNIQEESNSVSNISSKHANMQSGQLNSSDSVTKKPSAKGSTAAAASRSATPTARPTLTKSTKPSRSATPTSRVALPSGTKAVVPPVRSSTPTKAPARSSTPTAKTTARSATPNRCPSKPAGPSVVSGPTGRSTSTSKFNPRSSSNPRPSRGSFPSIKARPSKPSEMPNSPLDGAHSSLPERPASASKGRPVMGSTKSSSHAGRNISNGKTRQKSGSPSRRPASSGNGAYSGGKIFPFKQKLRPGGDNEVSPVVMGTKMVERVVNMRKLVPPTQDEYRSSNGDSSANKSCADTSGFGRTLSNKSLDMAMRHMDITRSISSKIRSVATKIQTSSTSNAGSRSTKAGTIEVSDSPLATSSNGSSAPSAWSNSIRLDGSETED